MRSARKRNWRARRPVHSRCALSMALCSSGRSRWRTSRRCFEAARFQGVITDELVSTWIAPGCPRLGAMLERRTLFRLLRQIGQRAAEVGCRRILADLDNAAADGAGTGEMLE